RDLRTLFLGHQISRQRPDHLSLPHHCSMLSRRMRDLGSRIRPGLHLRQHYRACTVKAPGLLVAESRTAVGHSAAALIRTERPSRITSRPSVKSRSGSSSLVGSSPKGSEASTCDRWGNRLAEMTWYRAAP